MSQQATSILSVSKVNAPVHEKGLLPFSYSILFRSLAVALGFFCSAGWDWIPSLHNAGLRDLPEFRQVVLQTGLFCDIASIGWFKILMLVFLGLALDNLFLTLQLRRSGSLRNPDLVRHCAFSGPILFSPRINERIHLVLPALIVQLVAIVLLGLVESYGSGALRSLVPWVLGTVSSLFGLLWFALMVFLPGAWCCVAYAVSALLGAGFSMLLTEQSVAYLACCPLWLPLLGLPLLFLAMPSSREIKERLVRYRRRCLCQAHDGHLLLLRRMYRPAALFGIFSGTNMMGTACYLFALLYGIQFLLEFAFGSFLIPKEVVSAEYWIPDLHSALLGQACGAAISVFLITGVSRHALFVPILGMTLLGAGALLVPLTGTAIVQAFILHIAAGCCSVSALFIMQMFLRNKVRVFWVLGWGLTLTVIWGLAGGYLLWFLTMTFGKPEVTYHELYMKLLVLTALFCLLCFYWIWERYKQLITSNSGSQNTNDGGAAPDWKEPLTAREREVASMVQAGIKNIEISEMLHISDATLRVHLRRIYRKLGIQGRAKLKAMPRFHR